VGGIDLGIEDGVRPSFEGSLHLNLHLDVQQHARAGFCTTHTANGNKGPLPPSLPLPLFPVLSWPDAARSVHLRHPLRFSASNGKTRATLAATSRGFVN